MEQGLNNPGPLTIFLVFTAGLLTSLGPCSLSLLPITIAYVGGTKNNKFKLISFSGGVIFSLITFGCLERILRKNIWTIALLLRIFSSFNSNYYGLKLIRNFKIPIT